MNSVMLRTLLMALCLIPVVQAAPVHLVDEPPVSITQPEPGVILVDFGRVAFGNIILRAAPGASEKLTVHFGEASLEGRINREPPGTVRYSAVPVALVADDPIVVSPPVNERNTQQGGYKQPPAILTPQEWGVLQPFRWVEIEGWNGELGPEQITRRAAYSATWDDDAAAFESSDTMLNRVWELSRYSIKATTFAGVYVDGDRERIPYEADAYINQISHYYTDNDLQMSRDTFDYLMQYATWPTEWASHMVFMAYADWMQTGDIQWLQPRYDALKNKLLLERAGRDGLITSDWWQRRKGDLVDWPPAERDGYQLTRVNTVVNAFHLKSLQQMAELARALGLDADAESFEQTRQSTYTAFQEKLFLPAAGVYRDGIGTDHISLHANLFPLAFDLVPQPDRAALADWLAGRGMACSVYAAQYLLQGLFENGAGAQAVELITAPGDRSWRHMIESGLTITSEAWDMKYKPNQDWNHAWGAAPANLLPRYVLGVEPGAPGWTVARIRPITSNLAYARGKVPTPHGPVLVDWENGEQFTLELTLPKNVLAAIELPAVQGASGVYMNGQPVTATLADGRWVLDSKVIGSVTLQVK
ncbi:Uncharacterised protein [Halioglobus japonicus]|nr:Uncharacterised protein [Halioglobus japonicus]